MQISVLKNTIYCYHCGKKASKGIVINNETYAESCAAEHLGLTLSSLRNLIQGK